MRPGNRHSQLTHAQDVGGALGDTDTAAGIQDVECVRAFETGIQRRQHQTGAQQCLAHMVIPVEQIPVERREVRLRHIHHAEGVFGLLDLVLMAHTRTVVLAVEFGAGNLAQRGLVRRSVVDHQHEALSVDDSQMGLVGESHRIFSGKKIRPRDMQRAMRRIVPERSFAA